MMAVTRLSVLAGIGWLAMLWTAGALAERTFSPRGYCQAHGGAVLETGDPDIHVCCYAAKQRCRVVNDRSRKSVPVAFPDDFSGAAPVPERSARRD